MRKLLLPLLCISLQPVGAVTINVADRGITPGADVSLKVNQLLKSLKGKSDVTLVFPKGQYEFYPDNAVEEWRAVSNHDNSNRRMAFPLKSFEKITIDGSGSTFMFHGRITPLVIDGSSDVTLKNFSIDWKRSFQNELHVVESDAENNTYVVEIDPAKYPYEIRGNQLFFNYYDWQDPVGSNIVFDPKTRAPIHNTHFYNLRVQNYKVAAAGKNRVKFTKSSKKAPPVGSVLIIYGVHPTSRLAESIHISNSKNTQIEDVTIHAAGGMGIIAERSENIKLNHLVVSSTKDRMVSTRADATHFINCKGTIELQDCLFEHMLDDGINVHGAYIKVEKLLGKNQLLCEISHFQQTGLVFAAPGDEIAITSRETILPVFKTTVKSVEVLNENRMIVTVSELPAKMPEGPLSLENLTWYPDLIMRDNIIRENRARSALITTKGKVLLENNYFSSQMHGILIEGDNKKWYESGAVQDITIRNNTFVNIGYEGGDRYPLYASPMLTPEQRIGEGHYHRNINFTNNTIKSFNGLMVFAKSVKGLNVSGNKLEFSSSYPATSEFPIVELQYCDSVKIQNNIRTGFKTPAKVKTSADSTNVQVTNNQGFELKKKDPVVPASAQ